jgi:hypothetical protein
MQMAVQKRDGTEKIQNFRLGDDFSHIVNCYCPKNYICHTFNENEFVSRGKIEHAKDLRKLEEAEG